MRYQTFELISEGKLRNGTIAGISVGELRECLEGIDNELPVELVIHGDVGAEDDNWIGCPMIQAVVRPEHRRDVLYLTAHRC